MVTLRSEGKQAAAAVQHPTGQSRKATPSISGRTPRRSITPDRASQDSALRRSQRVRDRQGALESIQEDTAASTEVRPSSAHGIAAQAEIGEHARASEDSAQQPAAAALPNPTVTRAQAVQEAILQADSNEGSKTADIDETNADEPESDSDEDLLAQLSQSMFAALRPQANIKDAPAEAARHRASQNDTAEGDSMRASQPQSLQTNRESPMTDEQEEEMHWEPLTGLPEPLTAKDCSALAAVSRPAQLEKQFKLPPRDTRTLDRQAAKLAPKTAGKQWFDLPAQQMTDDTKRDLKLLQLRGTFDPKRFYKSSDHKKGLPKFFQVGTVVQSAADFYSGRLPNKERKCTITEELLADPELSQARKRRFDKLQDEKAYWAGKRGRKTDLPRGKKVSKTKKR